MDFSLFTSEPPYNDVIFQDATQKLQIVPLNQQKYDKYLGSEFLRARQLVDCRAAAAPLLPAFYATLALVLVNFVVRFWMFITRPFPTATKTIIPNDELIKECLTILFRPFYLQVNLRLALLTVDF